MGLKVGIYYNNVSSYLALNFPPVNVHFISLLETMRTALKKHLSHPTVLSRSLLQTQTLYPSTGAVDMGKHSSVNDNTKGTTVYVSRKTYLVTLKNCLGNQALRSSEVCKQGPRFQNRKIGNTLFSIIFLLLGFKCSSSLRPP